MRLTAQEIAEATGGTWFPESARDRLVVESLSTDTRTLRAGDLFLALKGQRFDAHDYLAEAIGRGACALAASDSFPTRNLETGTPILKVPDTLRALGDIACAWRKKCAARRVAIVGSSGKTTTREMLAAILRRVAPTLAAAGNFNNLIGVPLTLLGLLPAHSWAILELGMNTPGELRRLTEITQPDLLALINVGTAHVGRFGSQEALLETKSEAIQALRPGVAVLYNQDCENSRRIVSRSGGDHPLLAFAIEQSAEIRARNIEPQPGKGYRLDLRMGTVEETVDLPVFGRYNIANAVAAAAVAFALGVEPRNIARGLEAFRPTAMRSEVRQVAGVTLIVDCYNANPDSMSAALDSLEDWPHPEGKTFLVLGEMLELGGQSEAFHRSLGRHVARTRAHGLFLLGEAIRVLLEEWEGADGAARYFDTHEALAESLIAEVRPGDRVFFKGSRANRLESVVERLENHLARPDAGKT